MQEACEQAIPATNIEAERELPSDIIEAVEQPVSSHAHEKFMIRWHEGRSVTMCPDGHPIENRRKSRNFFARSFYMTCRIRAPKRYAILEGSESPALVVSVDAMISPNDAMT